MLRVNNLTGFGGGAVPDIIVTDDGDSAPSSGTGTDTHTYSAKTSTGPDTILIVTSFDASATDPISSVTWSGNAMAELVQVDFNDALAAIFHIAGAQSGDIVVTFGASGITDSHITILSLANLQSATPVDTDTAGSTSATSATLSALTASPAGGIRIAACSHHAQTTDTSWTWTGHTEPADVNAGDTRHSVAYLINDTAGGNIVAGHASASGAIALVGVTLR